MPSMVARVWGAEVGPGDLWPKEFFERPEGSQERALLFPERALSESESGRGGRVGLVSHDWYQVDRLADIAAAWLSMEWWVEEFGTGERAAGSCLSK